MGYGKLRRALKTGMGGSHCGKGRSEKTEVMKKFSDKLRRQESKKIISDQLKDSDKNEPN